MTDKTTHKAKKQSVKALKETAEELKGPVEETAYLESVEADLLWEVDVSASVSKLASDLLMPSSIGAISALVLEHARFLTKSRHGYVAYLEPQTGYLVPAATIYEHKGRSQIRKQRTVFKAFSGLWGQVLKDRASLLTNTPTDETEPAETPLGHISIHRFLSAPALIEETLVGQIALANSERDYTERDLLLVKRLAVLYALALQRNRMDKALSEAHEKLEKRVERRTEQLEKTNEKLQAEIVFRRQAQEEMKKAKNAAEAANQAKSEFLANMSHEVRTPLNHIIGFTELLLDKNFGELTDVQQEYLNDIHHSSNHLLSLINDILDLSKVEAGKEALEVSEVNINTLFENARVMIQEKVLKHGIGLSLNTDGTPEKIRADERKLKQIMYNLLSNAVKFTPDGGEIRLKAEMISDLGSRNLKKEKESTFRIPHSAIRISISDTGIGLKKADFKRIFNPFEQADGSISRKYQGTGLGLSLTKRLVELHGGKIWAESEGEGKGATFRFILPL
jgi:signal transduction histidine kinase